MAEQGKEHKLTQADYNDNLNELYKAAKVTGVTKISMADFSNKMITSPGYRGLIYNGLKKAGVEGIGDNQSDFVSAILPKEKAVAQVALYNENKAKKAASSPKAKQTQQAAEVGKTMFGGGEPQPKQTNVTDFSVPQVEIPQVPQATTTTESGEKKPESNWRENMWLDAERMKQVGKAVETSAKNGDFKEKAPSVADFQTGRATQTFGGGATWIDENGKVHEVKGGDVFNPLRNETVKNAEMADTQQKNHDIAIDAEIEEYGKTHSVELQRQTRKELENVYANNIGKPLDGVLKAADKAINDELRQEFLSTITPELAMSEDFKNEEKVQEMIDDYSSRVYTPAQLQEKYAKPLYEAISKAFANKEIANNIQFAADMADMSKEAYIRHFLMPKIEKEVGNMMEKSIMRRYMPKSDAQYIIGGVKNWLPVLLVRSIFEDSGKFSMEQEVDREYGKKAGWATNFGRGATEFADPTFPLSFKGGGATARLVEHGIQRGAMSRAGKALALDKAINAATKYQMQFGTKAGQMMTSLLGANAKGASGRFTQFMQNYLTSLPREVAGQSLGMGLYGAGSAGLNAYGQTKDIMVAGEEAWNGLTSGENLKSGAAFAVAMPFIHGMWDVAGLGWKTADSTMKKAAISGAKFAYDGASILATAAVMDLDNLIRDGLDAIYGKDVDFNKTLNEYIHETAMAAAMKINPTMLVGLAKRGKYTYGSHADKDNLAEKMHFTDSELKELYQITGKDNLRDVLTSILPDNVRSTGRASQAEVNEAQTNFLRLMNRLSWDTQNKLAVGLTGSFTVYRPRTARFEADGMTLYEYDKDNNLLSRRTFETEDEKKAYLAEKRLNQEHIDLMTTYAVATEKNKEAVQEVIRQIADENGINDADLVKIFAKKPIRRTDFEKRVMLYVSDRLHDIAFPKGEVHTEQSAIDGEKAAQDAEVTSDEPKTEVVNNTNVEVTQAMADFAEAMKDAVWKEDYEELKKQGMSDADIYNTLMEQYNEAELAPLANFINAQAKQQGFMQGVANEIEQKTSEQTNLVTSGKVTINGVERTDGRVITLVDADGNIVRLLSGDFKLNEDGTIETEQPIIVSDDNGNPRPLNSVDGWKVAGSTDAGEYASYIRELLGQKATAVIDPNGEFAQGTAETAAPKETLKETPKAETPKEEPTEEDVTLRTPKDATTSSAERQGLDYAQPLEAETATKGSGITPQVTSSEGKGTENISSEQENNVKPSVNAENSIPLDENGKKNYVADGVRPVDAVNDIYNRGVFNAEQADAYVQSKIEEARKAYGKVNKDIAPKKGEDPDDYLARLQAHDAEVTAAKQVLDRWQAIYDEAHKFDAKEEEAEDAMKTDDIDMRGLEDDPRYFIATHMLKITPESFNEQVGLGAREKRAMPGFLAKKENGGVSIFEATDHIMQFLKDQGVNVSEDFVKNTIIDILTSGGPRSYIKNMREEFLANVSREEAYERAKMDKEYLDNYGMEYDEYNDYLEAERQRVSELYRGVDEDAFHAYCYEKWQEYDKMVADHDAELKEIEETLNSKKNGEETGRTETGDGLLHQEEARKEGRAGEMPDETGKLQSGDRVQDKNGLVPKEASRREAVENPSIEETKAETPKVDRLNDTTLSAEERIKGEKPLTEQEIDNLPDELFNDVVKTQIRSALEKLGNGDKLSALEELFYLNALKHVRTTTERGAENSTDANGAQLADGDNARSSNGGEGGETGNVAGERGGETPKEQLRGQDSEGNVRTVSGESGDREVRGGEPADDGVSTSAEQPDRSGEPRSEGSNGGRHGNPSERNQADGEAVRNEIQSSIEARKKKLAELAKRIKKTPKNTPPRLYDAASALGAWIGKQIDSVDFVAVGEFSKETMLLGGDYLRLGIHDFKEWAKRVKGELGDLLKDTFDWKDAEVDDFIREMWNSKYEMDGETRTIAEWASILGDRELRKEISRSLDEKRQLQKDAENIEVKVGDKDNIDQTLPFLLPEQRGDVLKAETAFFGEKHQDRTHGFGKGMMFTNGTGTGKTYTGLGIVKRFVKQGKGRVLIVTPSQPKVADWVKDGQNLGLEVTPLENTKDAGKGVVCTTYANLRANEAVLRDTFDLIVYDESHKIMENKKGEETIGTAVHYQLSNKNKQHAVERVKMKYEPFRKEKELRQEADDTRNIQENAINKLRELDISLPKHPTNSAEIDEHIRAIEQEGENVEGNKEKLNYLRIAKNAFNRLGEIPREIEALKPEQEKLMPEIEKEAEEAVKRTKSVFLSATPFNTRESLKYAEGYLFSYPEENKNTVGTYNHRSPEQAFLEQHFSAGYRWRYGRLEQHMENAEALAKQEVRFSDYLQDQLGTLSTRQIDNGYDYSRTFPTVTLDKAEAFNQALQDVFHDKTMQPLWEAFHDVFYDYNKQTALFETMKTALAAERIREHLARGRKVVVFHRRRTTEDELHNPFQQALTIAKVNSENMSAQDKQKVADAIAAFHGKYGDLLKWEQGLDYRLPREQLADIFGEDKVAFFSGEETTKQKNQSIADFMKDNKGKDIIVIQEASGKEGISLHDQTGEHQRVQISLCLPQSPIAFIQSEGRIYRIGQKSNAVFEYPLLGLNLEINLWAHKFNNALGTTEYLAMGSKARNLSESIAKGIMENSGTIGYDDAGVGGKAYDGNVEAQTATGFDGAITDYFTNQKISAKRENREGVDYFPTPEPVGYKMVEWAGLTEGESALEPSAGHGAIARYVPKSNNLTMIEPSQSLMSKLVLNTPGSGRKYEGGTFEDYNVINKHDAIVMNPPYGAGGTTAVEHVAKGFKHLNEGGRLIAIIPDGPACDKKMQKWLESKDAESAVITGEIKLPSCTFGRAGTAVNTRIVVIDKVTREEVRNGMPTRKEVDLRNVTDVNELFEKIRDIDMPERTIDKEYLREKAAKNFRRKIADPDSANKFVVSFVEANQKFVRIDFKRGGISLWIDVEEIQNNKDEALRSYRRIKERYDTADASFRANRIFTMGRGSNKVEIREADIKRDIYQNAMEFVAKVAGTTVKELDTRNNELMDRLRNGSKPTEQPQAEVKPQESRWEYSVVKHTQTGADLHIVKSKERMTDEEYRKELARAKELGGFYDRYSKGFRFETKENADKFMQQEGETRFSEDLNDNRIQQLKNGNTDGYNEETKVLVRDALQGRKRVRGEFADAERRTCSEVQLAAATIAADRGGVPQAGRRVSQIERGTKEEIERGIEDYAKANDAWFDEKEIAENSQGGSLLAEGGENRVYLSKDGKTVTKVLEPYMRNENSMYVALRNIKLFNELFPNAAITVKGFLRDGDGKMRIVTEQPYIQGMNLTRERYEELGVADKVREYFKERGLEDVYGDALEFKNDKYYVRDIHYGNIILDKNGVPQIFDANVTLHKAYEKEVRKDGFGFEQESERMSDTDNFDRLRMGDKAETFKERQQRAVEQKGVVMPGLNEATVKVVDDIPRHSYTGDIKEATSQAIEAAKAKYAPNGEAKTLHYDNFGTEFDYSISGNAIDVLLSPKHQGKSVNKGAHLALAENIDKVIAESIEVEEHPDRIKTDDVRDNNNINPDALMHRFYGVARIDGKDYRVMTLMREEGRPEESNGVHSYEVQKIEVLNDETSSTPNGVGTPNSELEAYPLAKVIKDVGKTMEKDKNLLEESKLSDKLQSEVSKPEDKPTVRAHIDTVSKDLNTPCEVHNDASTIKNEKVRKAIESGRKVKGWWDKDGVHLYMPNIHSRHDAETTILHETVGHDGLRKLMNGKDGKGRNFEKFLDMVWADKKNTALHEFVKEYAPKNGWDLHEAVDEWLAREAEKPVTNDNFGMWGRVKAMFNNALRALGFKSDMSLNDVRYAIWLSKRMKQKPNDPLMKARAAAFRWGMEHSNYKPEVKDGRYVDSEDGKDETRLAASLTPLHTACVQEYNRLLDNKAFRTHEAFTDNMNSLRILQKLISGKDYYDIKDSENAYIAENHASSKSEAAWNKFKVQKYQPLEAAINECVGLFGGNPTETIGKMEDYGMKKHGLERNRKLFVRDAIEAITDAQAKQRMTLDWDNERHRLSGELFSGKIDYRKYLEGLDNFIRKNIDSSYDPNKNDYSGISAYDPNRIKRGRKVEYDENAIIDDVMDMETLLGDKAQNFWDAVRDATDFAVDYSYETGMIDSKSQDHIKDMFDFYLPLRGFNEETMEDVYDYIGGRGNGADLPIRNAKGRLSEAESPLAHIAKMAMTSITRGEDNKVRQMFYRLVANHPSDAAKVSDVWEVKTKDPVTGNETWEVTLPDIPTDATPREIADIMDNFEALMESKKGSGDARKATSRPNYGRVFENKAHASQHIVRTSINGKPKMVYVLGNPRAAQALNGEVVNKNNSHVKKWIINKMAKLSTSYSPEFILSNTSRDTLFANANIASKENAAYYAKFTKNQVIAGTVLSLTGIGGDRLNGESLFEKYYRGHIDTSKPMEKMFAEFMDNGGRTGFLAIQEIENLEKDLKASIKGGRVTDKTKRVAKALWNSIPKGIEQMNMRAELINRFATYMTSRQMGRSILRSVADAKEVSVNFNRKGAGNATEGFIGWSAGALRNNFMFFNASMQSAELLYRNMKGMDSKTIKTTLFMGAVPAAVGTAFAMFLASQEDEEYSNIPSWDRRNNICIPIKGEGYIKIPLPIELRAFWGMGDITASLTYKRLQTEESPAFAMCGQITQILPIDILESGQMNLTDSSGYSPLLPTYVQPLYQYIVNKSWTGKPIEKESKFNPDAPRWTRAYSSTNRFLVKFCKYAHDTFREGKNTAQETDTTGDGWWIDPSLYDHLLKSYFGGAYSIAGKSINTWDNWRETGEIDFAHAPMVSRVWGGFSEKEADATTNAKFWAYKREADNVGKEFSNAANKTNPMAITELKESSRGKRYAIYKSADKDLQRLRKIISHSDNPDKVAEAERKQKELRRDLVDALDNVE